MLCCRVAFAVVDVRDQSVNELAVVTPHGNRVRVPTKEWGGGDRVTASERSNPNRGRCAKYRAGRVWRHCCFDRRRRPAPFRYRLGRRGEVVPNAIPCRARDNVACRRIDNGAHGNNNPFRFSLFSPSLLHANGRRSWRNSSIDRRARIMETGRKTRVADTAFGDTCDSDEVILTRNVARTRGVAGINNERNNYESVNPVSLE